MTKVNSHEDERYNPITEPRRIVNKGAEGLDCVHEMNTINHYVGMYPIDTGAPVEKPLAKFFFGFFAVMLLAFMATQASATDDAGRGFRGRGRLDGGGPDRARAIWKPCRRHYVQEAGTFFNEPDKIKVWGAICNRHQSRHGRPGRRHGDRRAGVWKIRGFPLLLALVPALLPVFFVLDYAGWLWFFGHNMHPWGAFTVKPFMPTVFGEGKVAQFSTYSYPYWGYALLLLAISPA